MEVIFKDKQKSIKITMDQSYDRKFLEFAESVLWGTEGNIYIMNNVEIEFKKFNFFVSLMENDELIGICLLKQKQIHQHNCTFDTFYRSFLSIHPSKLNKGYGTLVVNIITDYIFTKFEKVIMYVYCEEENIRIRRTLQKANYSHLTTFLALSHVSLRPKLNEKVTGLDKSDESKILTLLNDQYDNHSFVDINDSFNAGSYYVLKENNEIKAGLQVKILSWSFVSLSGFYGFLLMKIVPKLPLLKKIFNPKKQLFLKIGNVYIPDSKSFAILLKAVLQQYKLYTSVACFNPNSSVDAKVIAEMKKGLLSSVSSKLFMLYKSKNVNLDEIGITAENCFFSNF